MNGDIHNMDPYHYEVDWTPERDEAQDTEKGLRYVALRRARDQEIYNALSAIATEAKGKWKDQRDARIKAKAEAEAAAAKAVFDAEAARVKAVADYEAARAQAIAEGRPPPDPPADPRADHPPRIPTPVPKTAEQIAAEDAARAAAIRDARVDRGTKLTAEEEAREQRALDREATRQKAEQARKEYREKMLTFARELEAKHLQKRAEKAAAAASRAPPVDPASGISAETQAQIDQSVASAKAWREKLDEERLATEPEEIRTFKTLLHAHEAKREEFKKANRLQENRDLLDRELAQVKTAQAAALAAAARQKAAKEQADTEEFLRASADPNLRRRLVSYGAPKTTYQSGSRSASGHW
ncbi:hypothetical protein QBC38DRAFT_545336 [Podospora fimiseda]|uniref:Uncharacterized protein n=1 Tax=Podospora fimiseda TaxID=252190 RepID=A0AAN7BPG9_9PEZI|nr:hypothetical protein QBC38DRAFT_545336 [Podospora fimiseda]